MFISFSKAIDKAGNFRVGVGHHISGGCLGSFCAGVIKLYFWVAIFAIWLMYAICYWGWQGGKALWTWISQRWTGERRTQIEAETNEEDKNV